MARRRRTWVHDRFESNRRTIIATESERRDLIDVEVHFFVGATDYERAIDSAYDCLDLEDFCVRATPVIGGHNVICSFAIVDNDLDTAHEFVSKAWLGTPAWRAVLTEIEYWANYSVV